jgi:uncharacterized membrane protein YdjX (TVP38/TMEM64 family)
MTTRARKVVSVLLLALLAAALAAPLIAWHRELWSLFSSRDRLQEWLRAWGPLARLVFVGLQVFQVVVFAVPGEVVQVAGGWLFGIVQGALLAVAGVLVGATACFYLARLLGRPFLEAFVPAERSERLRALVSSPRGTTTLFLLYLIPGIPKDILGYVAGISPLRFGRFILVSTLGRLPGLVGSAVIGSAAASRQWVLFGIVGGAAVVLFGTGLLLRPRIQRWLEARAGRRGAGPGTGPTAS